MSEVLNLIEGGHVFYPVSDEFLLIFAEDFSMTLTSCGNAWWRIPTIEVQKVLWAAVKLYYFRSFYEILRLEGRSVPVLDDLDQYSKLLMVPRFVRDMIREFCRPMNLSSTVYLPDIRFTSCEISEKLSDLFGSVPALSRWNETCRKAGFELYEIAIEVPKCCPLSFFVPESQAVFSVSQLEDWRIEAVVKLRHLEWFQPPLDVSAETKTIPSIPLEVYESPIDGRRVGNTYCFSYSTIGVRRRMGLFAQLYRFPTIEEHSRTPPRSLKTGLRKNRKVKDSIVRSDKATDT